MRLDLRSGDAIGRQALASAPFYLGGSQGSGFEMARSMVVEKTPLLVGFAFLFSA